MGEMVRRESERERGVLGGEVREKARECEAPTL